MTGAELIRVFATLREVFPEPTEYRGKASEMERVYLSRLGDLAFGSVQRAALEYTKSEADFWPKPGKLRGLALKAGNAFESSRTTGDTASYWAWEGSNWGARIIDGRITYSACPVCGVYPTTNPRTLMVHDSVEHERRNTIAVGETEKSYTPDGDGVMRYKLTQGSPLPTATQDAA